MPREFINWDASWDDKAFDPYYVDYANRYPSGSKYIAYRDFTSLTKDNWDNPNYKKMDTDSFVTNEYAKYYENPAFITAFEAGENRGVANYELDELDRIACVIYNISDMFDLSGIDRLSAEKFESILNSINGSSPFNF